MQSRVAGRGVHSAPSPLFRVLWCSPRLRRCVIGGVVVGGGGAALLLPPKESLPAPLFIPRVFLEGTGRLLRCLTVAAAIFFDYQWSVLHRASYDDQAAWNKVHQRCARRLVRLAELNGGLYVKAGQIFSNMAHVLPPVYCKEMSILQDAVMARPFSEILHVLRTDLGEGAASPAALEDLFEYIDPVPIAAASLAQVHRGRRRSVPPVAGTPGPSHASSSTAPPYAKDVAIKVQYIDIAARFKGDMVAISSILSVVGWAYPGYNLYQVVKELESTLEGEFDFRLEAANSMRAARDLQKGGFGEDVVCPTIHLDLLRPRILTMDFVEGVKINDAAGQRRLGLDPSQLVGNFIRAMGYQMFISGFFHADPHAGNVLVRPMPQGQKDAVDGAGTGGGWRSWWRSPSLFCRRYRRGQVVLLDFGLCSELSCERREELADIWVACVSHDDARVRSLARHFSLVSGKELDYEIFASCFLQHPYALHDLGYKSRVTGPAAREEMRVMMREKMFDINDVVASLPPEYSLILRSLMACKTINKDMGDTINRQRFLLRYALQCPQMKHYSLLSKWLIYAKATVFGWHSNVMLMLFKMLYPEMLSDLENEFQFSG